ncbi:MAG: hypothetical protein ABW034_02515 [Steroidobacteraceae bacterium]
MISDQLINPFKHDPKTELPHTPVAMPGWTEHYFFFGYDVEAGLGMNVHIGRLPVDSSIWRAVVQMYLPGGEELLVAKYHGRDGDFRGPGAGPMKLTCVEPLRKWTVDFDGAAFSTTRAVIMREVLRDGPAEPVRFHMLFEAAGPLFGRQEDHAEGRSSSTFHSEQICHMSGFFQYRGRYVPLKGMGVRDHSSGPRDYGPVVSDIWFHSLFPSGKVIQTQVVRFEEMEYKTAYVFRNNGEPLEMAEILEHPHVNARDAKPKSLCADPLSEAARSFRIVLQTKAGKEVIEGELLHSHAITYTSPMEELIGTTLDRPDGVQMCEAPARVRCNGEVGLALRERVARTGTLFAAGSK